MKAFILLSLACLAVSLPTYAGTRQADLDLALADPTSLPAPTAVAPTAATPSNAVLFRRRGPGIIASILLGAYLPRRYASKTLSKEPSKILSEEPSKDPTSLPAPTAVAPTAAAPSNAVLFRRRGAGVVLAALLSRLPPRRYASKTLSKEPSKDPTSLPAPTAATSSNAALFRKRGVGVMLSRPKPLPPRRCASKTLSEEPSKEPGTES
ncbi:hypothetical protein CEP51_016644 [Fusarium floridanum]|uniref:Uncharacterized protein n=1 Tax=Fusarium floridanum TaxID=1325733 RepID=A0A428NJB0_9HYPO|nr:hypothetical protein CEP51_016644 [Fusarium floridanum]